MDDRVPLAVDGDVEPGRGEGVTGADDVHPAAQPLELGGDGGVGPQLERGVGVRFKGVEKTNVEEYCVSEGWVRLSAGKTLDRAGNPMTVKLKGTVEPYFRDPAAEA